MLSQGEVTVAAEEWVELANGCLCCSVKTEFVSALEGLMEKRSRFDYILIETTGAPSPWLINHGDVVLSSTIASAKIRKQGPETKTNHVTLWPIHGEYSDLAIISIKYPVKCLSHTQPWKFIHLLCNYVQGCHCLSLTPISLQIFGSYQRHELAADYSIFW